MKVSTLLPFVALASAFVIPDETVMSQIQVESEHRPEVAAEDGFLPTEFMSSLHEVISEVEETVEDFAVNIQDTLKSHHKHRGPKPCDGADGITELDKPHRPHKPHKPHKPEKSLYELINGNKYTTKFAELVEKFDDIKELFMSSDANVTIFVPSDKAFEKVPKHAPKPSDEFLKKLIQYHIVTDVYPAKRVFASHTLPTLLEGEYLSKTPAETPQRLNVKFGFSGLTINGYSKIRYPNFFATNGVIHGVDSIIIPPPPIAGYISFLPQEFSTLELALHKTGLAELANTTHYGATLFAPSNNAFKGLGVKANAFLFSKYGRKYLKALIKYHIVPNATLYSDAFYSVEGVDSTNIPRSRYHVDLPTLLKDRHLEIDVARFGALIEIKINAFSRVAYQDLVAKDGVIQIPNRVLIPPKQYKSGEEVYYQGGEISEEELREHLEPYVCQHDHDEEEEEEGEWTEEL